MFCKVQNFKRESFWLVQILSNDFFKNIFYYNFSSVLGAHSSQFSLTRTEYFSFVLCYFIFLWIEFSLNSWIFHFFPPMKTDFNGPTCQSSRRGSYDSSYLSQTPNGEKNADRMKFIYRQFSLRKVCQIIVVILRRWILGFLVAGSLKAERNSSLDCLSSIVERISTDTSSGPLPAEGRASPGPVLASPPQSSRDPNLIYQVL